MARKLLTAEELVALDGISAEDKALIEACTAEHGGYREESPDTTERKALRGFLAQEFLDSEPNESLREELGGDAAAFVDGWAWCQEHGLP